jgi:hypothetical protein
MQLREVRDLLDQQDGVVSRRQLLERGATDADIRRWQRRRELTRVHPGVFVNHTGPLRWVNRAWAAVLFAWPSALAFTSATDRAGDVIHVAIDASRTVVAPAGVRIHRLVDLDARVAWNLSPPRVRFDDALLSVAGEQADRVQALAVISDACRRRSTTPARLASALEARSNAHHRRWLLAVLQEAADGVQSVLESAYLRRVERAHGLPRADRQHYERTLDGVLYRDVKYSRFTTVIELDGRVGHELSGDRWDDQDRDLLAAVHEVLTLRLGWRHCEATPCVTAGRLAAVLRARGWRGTPRRCGQACRIDEALWTSGHQVTKDPQSLA